MNQYTALIADDADEMRLLLSRTLETLGFNVVALTNDGEEALNEIKAKKPDICFLDIEMPILSGIDVLKKIKESDLQTFPVIISGNNTVENVKSAIEQGAKGFIVKPYSFDKVKQITDKFLKIHETGDE